MPFFNEILTDVISGLNFFGIVVFAISGGLVAARKALGLDREDPGVFWMAVDDFLAYFVELTVCRVLRDRVDARVGIRSAVADIATTGAPSAPGRRSSSGR